ncbi:IclR family transcriptional regulator C-terminal domain-containing protein [Marinobacter sp. 1_MG-2023]|uniref:IclR family transcriptional regulator domain-containing protein n=1 Tax=Marinobacter sp. 1_MG-2023 TaxID=3062627 RepID=UPI0026E4243F|nr:IclR family transcriptional regulator C-terminal domain-containing protein [Marinobacter sp. 1_MG-2023]MDO6824183.1 IclR family transcriptional regulator C-terminal domain-containing protein [Marinobacter sp. 1_MG-2023]
MDDQVLEPGDRDYVGALASGLEVLQAFDAERPRMTLSEVAARTKMDRAKARRFLLTLHALGFVKRSGRQFALTPRVMQLGYAYQASNQYRPVIQQYLEDITCELGESSSLAVLDGDDVVYVVRSSARHRLMAITLSVGTRLPAAYTSMGRVLLAQLPEAELEAFLARVELAPHTVSSITDSHALNKEIAKVRSQGYSIVDQELDSGLRSAAVPVFAGNGELLGAINISTNAARVDMKTLLDVYLSRLQKAAEAVRLTTH